MNLLQFCELVPDEDAARAFVREVRWPDGVRCPRCDSPDILWESSRNRWRCRTLPCYIWFSFRFGTLLESSGLPAHKWLVGMFVFVANSRGVTSTDLVRYLGVAQPTGYRLLRRMRGACQMDPGALTDVVKVERIHLDGKKRNQSLPYWRRRLIYRPLSQLVLGVFDHSGRLVHLGVSNSQDGESVMDVLATTLAPGVVADSRSAHVLGEINNKSIGDVLWPIKRVFTTTQLEWGKPYVQLHMDEVAFRLHHILRGSSELECIEALIRNSIRVRSPGPDRLEKKMSAILKGEG